MHDQHRRQVSVSPRTRGNQRRRQILDAAVAVIAERGICDARVVDIATRAGTSAGLVLYYFESKDHLLAEALAYAEDGFYLETFREIASIDDARVKLACLFETACPTTAAEGLDKEWSLWIELWSRALRDANVARTRRAMDRRWRSTIADVVRQGQQAGVFVENDPLAFATEVAALIDGLAVQVMLGDADMTREHMLSLCLRFASQQLGSDLAEALERSEHPRNSQPASA